MKNKYYGTILISDKTKDVYQNIYASQAYGTFFGIHGKLIKNSDNKLKSIDLILTNYKGHFNLKIETASLDLKTTLKGDKYLILDVKIKAPIINFPEAGTPVIISKKAKEVDLSEVQFFLADRTLISMSGHTYKELCEMDSNHRRPLMNGTFDHEFFYRNGSKISLREVGDFKLSVNELGDDDPVDIKDGNPFCKQRLSQLFIQ